MMNKDTIKVTRILRDFDNGVGDSVVDALESLSKIKSKEAVKIGVRGTVEKLQLQIDFMKAAYPQFFTNEVTQPVVMQQPVIPVAPVVQAPIVTPEVPVVQQPTVTEEKKVVKSPFAVFADSNASDTNERNSDCELFENEINWVAPEYQFSALKHFYAHHKGFEDREISIAVNSKGIKNEKSVSYNFFKRDDVTIAYLTKEGKSKTGYHFNERVYVIKDNSTDLIIVAVQPIDSRKVLPILVKGINDRSKVAEYMDYVTNLIMSTPIYRFKEPKQGELVVNVFDRGFIYGNKMLAEKITTWYGSIDGFWFKFTKDNGAGFSIQLRSPLQVANNTNYFGHRSAVQSQTDRYLNDPTKADEVNSNEFQQLLEFEDELYEDLDDAIEDAIAEFYPIASRKIFEEDSNDDSSSSNNKKPSFLNVEDDGDEESEYY